RIIDFARASLGIGDELGNRLSRYATLATKRALPLTWAGLPPAGSHQLAWRTHSITSSARASKVGGISRPSARAVWRLITNSHLVGCTTGKSAGLAPLRI